MQVLDSETPGRILVHVAVWSRLCAHYLRGIAEQEFRGSLVTLVNRR
jgi:hypothetical protein